MGCGGGGVKQYRPREPQEIILAKARKSFYEAGALILGRRNQRTVKRGDGWFTEKSWLQAIGKAECRLDKMMHQGYYVELWFEAKAMRAQFEHYTKYITLRPFGGDPSIPYKWQAAQELERASKYYNKPIVILYFGDYDKKGLSIPESALKDIEECAM